MNFDNELTEIKKLQAKDDKETIKRILLHSYYDRLEHAAEPDSAFRDFLMFLDQLIELGMQEEVYAFTRDHLLTRSTFGGIYPNGISQQNPDYLVTFLLDCFYQLTQDSNPNTTQLINFAETLAYYQHGAIPPQFAITLINNWKQMAEHPHVTPSQLAAIMLLKVPTDVIDHGTGQSIKVQSSALNLLINDIKKLESAQRHAAAIALLEVVTTMARREPDNPEIIKIASQMRELFIHRDKQTGENEYGFDLTNETHIKTIRAFSNAILNTTAFLQAIQQQDTDRAKSFADVAAFVNGAAELNEKPRVMLAPPIQHFYNYAYGNHSANKIEGLFAALKSNFPAAIVNFIWDAHKNYISETITNYDLPTNSPPANSNDFFTVVSNHLGKGANMHDPAFIIETCTALYDAWFHDQFVLLHDDVGADEALIMLLTKRFLQAPGMNDKARHTIYYQLGEIYLARHERDKAHEYLKQIPANADLPMKYRLNLANYYEHLFHQPLQAQQILQAALESQAGHEEDIALQLARIQQTDADTIASQRLKLFVDSYSNKLHSKGDSLLCYFASKKTLHWVIQTPFLFADSKDSILCQQLSQILAKHEGNRDLHDAVAIIMLTQGSAKLASQTAKQLLQKDNPSATDISQLRQQLQTQFEIRSGEQNAKHLQAAIAQHCQQPLGSEPSEHIEKQLKQCEQYQQRQSTSDTHSSSMGIRQSR